MDWMLHVVPFHLSATVVSWKGVKEKATPTAVQAKADEHATPEKKSPFPSVPEGVGVD
jgi:hypothetical protein